MGGDQYDPASPPANVVETDETSEIALIASSLRQVYKPQEDPRQDLVNLLLMLSHIPYERHMARVEQTRLHREKRSIVRMLLKTVFRRRSLHTDRHLDKI